MTDSPKNIWIVLVIVAACGIVYGQVAAFDFINIDDRPYVWENAAVISGLNTRSITWAFTTFHAANWHPLTWLSHMLDAELFGPWAGGHHLTNVVIHTLNSLLVFFVFRSMTDCRWKSAVVALLFAVHPAHVESVAWIAERKDVLSTMFSLLTILAYIRYARSAPSTTDGGKQGGPSWQLMLPVIICFALGLMAKPMLVTLPFVLILCDYWPLGRLKTVGDLRPLMLEKVPLFILTAISSVITVIAQRSAGATASLEAVPLDTRITNAVTSYGRYIRMAFYPADLGIWYPLGPTDAAAFLASGILLASVTIFAWRFRSGNEYLVMGWLWFVGTLVPVIGLVQVGMPSPAARYTYFPYLGLLVMVVWGGAALCRRWLKVRNAAPAIATIILLILSVIAYRQTSLWRDSEALYSHTLSFTENNQFLMSNLCLYYVQKTNAVTADQKCTELLGSMPPSADAFQILGYLKTETGKYDEAVRLLQEASRLDPASGEIRLHLAQALARRGNTTEAEQTLEGALTMNDARVSGEIVARASVILGDSFLKAGRRDRAIEYYRKALSRKPDSTEARVNLDKLGVK
ncbi:tetratricopeptide repeat protein [soil metagenome]